MRFHVSLLNLPFSKSVTLNSELFLMAQIGCLSTLCFYPQLVTQEHPWSFLLATIKHTSSSPVPSTQPLAASMNTKTMIILLSCSDIFCYFDLIKYYPPAFYLIKHYPSAFKSAHACLILGRKKSTNSHVPKTPPATIASLLLLTDTGKHVLLLLWSSPHLLPILFVF